MLYANDDVLLWKSKDVRVGETELAANKRAINLSHSDKYSFLRKERKDSHPSKILQSKNYSYSQNVLLN